jgi:hypothetical protein
MPDQKTNPLGNDPQGKKQKSNVVMSPMPKKTTNVPRKGKRGK